MKKVLVILMAVMIGTCTAFPQMLYAEDRVTANSIGLADTNSDEVIMWCDADEEIQYIEDEKLARDIDKDIGQPSQAPWVMTDTKENTNENVTFLLEYVRNNNNSMDYKLKLSSSTYPSCWKYDVKFTSKFPGPMQISWTHQNIFKNTYYAKNNVGFGWYSVNITVKTCSGVVYREIKNIPVLFNICDGQMQLKFGKPPFNICRECMKHHVHDA